MIDDKETLNEYSPKKPIGWIKSIFYFGIPAVVFIFAIYYITPFLENLGVSSFHAYYLASLFPLILMIIASIIFLKLETGKMNRKVWTERARFKPLKGKIWIWILGAVIFSGIAYLLVSQLTAIIVSSGIIPIPKSDPLFLDPTSGESPLLSFTSAVEGISGKFFTFILIIIGLILNIAGEEMWWRGVVLPRQELYFKDKTWLVHGVFWTLFHAFKYWDFLTLLPLAFAVTIVVCKFKNSSSGVVIHFTNNFIGTLPTILFLFGLINP